MPKANSAPPPGARVSLKMLADYLDLSPATVSFVLNNAPNRSIPEVTRERVRAAARKFGYRPNLIARSLRGTNTCTVGILIPVLGEGYHAQVLAGAADVLMREGYFFFTAHHRHRPDLTVHLDKDMQSPELGYPGTQQLLMHRRDFTAVVCFNDISAIGCIRALHDGGLRVPEDVSVVGFDDIQSASYHVPSLTTIRQPLQAMGELAATTLLKKMAHERQPDTLHMNPELIARESTGPAPAAAAIECVPRKRRR